MLQQQRPTEFGAGTGYDPGSMDLWWNAYGAPELKQRLAELGRQDVLNAMGDDNGALKTWYSTSGVQEYPNIWQASAAPQQGLAEGFAAAGGSAPKTPTFEETLPYEKAWGQLAPTAYQSALQQVSPEIARQYDQAKRSYVTSLANTGGGRFGRAVGGLGNVWAESERDKKAQAQDWTNLYEQGFNTLWWDPSETAWNTAMTQGKTPTMPTVPGWQQYANMYNSANPESLIPSMTQSQKSDSFRGLY